MISPKKIILLVLILIAVCLPRWNRMDYGPVANFTGKDSRNFVDSTEYKGTDMNLSVDSYQYLQYVNYYKGENVEASLQAPYTFRPLQPFIASYLPFDSMTSLNFVKYYFPYHWIDIFNSNSKKTWS